MRYKLETFLEKEKIGWVNLFAGPPYWVDTIEIAESYSKEEADTVIKDWIDDDWTIVVHRIEEV
jgi:hypothetical protein